MSLRTIAPSVLLLIASSLTSPFTAAEDTAKPDKAGEVRAVIKNAAESPSSVSFIHLAWSLNSEIGKRQFAQFAAEYARLYPEDAPLFHIIDCTSISNDYSALYELPGWDRKRHGITGMGEIVWLKDGRVLHVEEIGGFATGKEFIKKSRTLLKKGG